MVERMNAEEEILIILMEEAAEVIQECSKAIRFGIDNEYNGETTRQRLNKELGDLWALIEIAHSYDLVSWTDMDDALQQKMQKLKQWSNLDV